MRDFAIVTGIDGQWIEVVSLISDACVTCNSIECAKDGIFFHVINKKNLPLKINDKIRIGYPKIYRGILSLLALFTPICSAIAAYFFAPHLLEHFDIPLTETSRSLTVGGAFIFISFLIFLMSRTDVHIKHPEVIQIM